MYGSNWPNLRQAALERDEFRCQFCSNSKGNTNLVVHHIRPLKQGGKNELWNLITLCSSCHASDHAEINRHGLSTVPGPDWDSYWYELTNQEDVIISIERIESEYRETLNHLREREKNRPHRSIS